MHDMITVATEIAPEIRSASDIPEPFYVYLLEQHGVRISGVREQISAGLANKQDRTLLRLPNPSAVLLIEELALNQRGAPDAPRILPSCN